MEDLKQQISELKDNIERTMDQLSISKKTAQLNELREQSSEPDFWQNSDVAQKISKQIAKLEKSVVPWHEVDRQAKELAEFAAMDDSSLTAEIETKLTAVKNQFDELKSELRFAGKHDGDDVVLTIQAGAGGTDAQDWAELLKKMYLKWCDRRDLSVKELSEASGDEAGIKNTSLLVEGRNAYGLLKSEHGVHRLVRLSPFNSASSRETSFAMVEVVPQIDDDQNIELNEDDLKTDVYRAGGRGGQSVNTTDSAVRITHLPTGLTVAIQNERSQIQNKATALSIMRSKLAQLAEEQRADKVAELKGPTVDAAWGNQIRSYVLHPYTMVKDSRSGYETSDTADFLDGGERLDECIDSYLEHRLGDQT